MRQYHKFIFFTRTKLERTFKYQDHFQIFPIQEEGIPNVKIQKHFPNYIEFYTDESDNVKLQTPYPDMDSLLSGFAAPVVKQDLFLSLLTTCSNHLFFRYEDFTGNWGLAIKSENPEDYKDEESKWCIPIYGAKVLQGKNTIIKYSNIELDEVEIIRFADYFFGSIDPDENYSGPIKFPSIIKLFLDCYFELEEDDRIQINNAIHHLKTGIELSRIRKTISLISLFTSLETMVTIENRDFKPNQCETCGQLKFAVSKKFRNYLTKYVSNQKESKSKFNKLYSLRSKIVHTGSPLKSELLYSEISNQKREEEELKIKEVIQICRLSIINWVIQKTKPIKKKGDS